MFAAVKAKMQPLLEEMQLKQEHLVSQMEHMQVDVQAMRVQLHALDAGGRQRLEEELASLSRKMAGNHADSTSATAKLRVRVAAVEARNAQLAQELTSAQQAPPPAPRPEPPPQQEPLSPELLEALEKWLSLRFQEQEVLQLSQRESCSNCKLPIARKMADFALESQGASVISTRCSETYRTRSACVTLFGFPLWYPSESPRIVIQGYPVLLPGKCWAFHGVQGTLVIALSHPITISHVTLDHLPRYHSPTGRIDSAPKDFAVYGMRNETDEGTLLGAFTYDEDGESVQTFELAQPSEVVYRVVELRVLSNWGHVEYTCLYRFRVHGQIAAS